MIKATKIQKMEYGRFIKPGQTADDIMPLFANKKAFSAAVDELAKPFQNKKIDKVAGIEARRFILAGAVAYKLKAGFVAIRKGGYLQREVIGKSFIDYTGKKKVLEIQKDALKRGEKVLIVDDLFETGNQAKAAAYLIERLGGKIVGFAVIVDDTDETVKKFLNKYKYYYLFQW